MNHSAIPNKKITILFLGILSVGLCSYIKYDRHLQEPLFSKATATQAYDSFYNAFYSRADNLFYTDMRKTTLAQGWTNAIFFDITLDHYVLAKNPQSLQKIDRLYEGAYKAYSAFDWQKIKYDNGFIYDDMLWWVIALAKAYNTTGEKKYLDNAIAGFKFVWGEAYDSSNGAMIWSWKTKEKGNNACVNYPASIAAAMLYNITKKKDYLGKSEKIYDWAKHNLYKDGRIADGKSGNHPPNFQDYTYNQGTCIGAAVLLYKATKDKNYLNDAVAAADYTANKMCNKDGILPAEGDYNEQGVLKAIFAQYMFDLIYKAGQKQYLPWIRQNIAAAWNHRDTVRDLMFRNYTVVCPSGNIQSYEASSGVAFMQLFNSKSGE